MTRAEFEAAARAQNARRAQEREQAREAGAPCELVDMLAFGPGAVYCRAHGVFLVSGVCPFVEAR